MKYTHNGKTKNGMPNGLFHAHAPDFIPDLVDPDYNGFRIVFVKDTTKQNAAPYVISDSLNDVWNPIDGKRYDSKAKYYRTVKEAGCEIAGNDPALSRPRADKELSRTELKRDIARALESR